MPQGTDLVAREPQAAAKTILLVEDDTAISTVLGEAIALETPYQAIRATDGRAALELVQHCKPDLLLLDYMLPGMDGIELYDRIQSTQGVAPLPAILITASRHLPHQQIQQRHLITFKKPLDLDMLLATIATLLTSS